ncbi:phenolic glucoside malonyltransferase 1-like isoform X2 [Panicum virgatum]|uniref:Uncharacterized protein n=1 Tax=Panicum virgatum TaxID=38727 RepID=A0A8T0NPY0_PANVG|nr:phenolic glucoside malonyltransferase 1-like isoform X2 [Panicum virgatum]KAG2549256.1 hypothetical protein PVAP13_9KG163500 [Panicum virgatum]
MPPTVRTRRATGISLPSGGAPVRRMPLAPFDTYWVALPPVSRVFFFVPPSPPVSFTDIARDLRLSLAAVLPAFHPFAGKLAFSPESRTVAIVCGEDARVDFVEAETELELARLIEEGAEHDPDALGQLVPDIRREELPAPVMAAQVTEFVGGGGGIALGVAVHHAAADGRGILRFLQMWAAAAVITRSRRGRVGVAAEPMPPPIHDRSLVRFHGDEELASVFLRHRAPELPRIVPKQGPSSAATTAPLLCRSTFTFAASVLRRLKQRIADMGAGTVPSTMAALAAHGWVSIARASNFTDGAPVHAVFLADCRAHMSPPVPAAYAGNCVVPCFVTLTGAELGGLDGHARALFAIREAVEEVKRDPLADRSRWSKLKDIPRGRAVILAGSPLLTAYALDFGFGRPALSEAASMNHDGEIFLIAGREAGSVQASVAVAAGKMKAFREIFVLDSSKKGGDGCSRL